MVEDNRGLGYKMLKKYSQIPPDEWDEVFAEICVPGLMRAARTFRPEKGQFSTWACNIIQKDIWRHRRKTNEHKSRFFTVDFSDEHTPHPSAPDDEPATFLPDVLAALKGLDKRDREIIELRYFDKKTLNAIGNQFGKTREWARQTINAILQRMRHPKKENIANYNRKDVPANVIVDDMQDIARAALGLKQHAY